MSPPIPSRVVVVLGVLAFANVAAGLWLSLQANAGLDVLSLADWSGTWARGINLYASGKIAVDYPPWALVTLWPLSVLAQPWRVPAWVCGNLVLACAFSWRLAGLGEESRVARLRLAGLLTATACLRTFAQFSLLSFALAVAGALAESPIAGGILLGLSLIKPQIGGVVLLWVLLRRDWVRAAIATMVPIALSAVFMAAVRVGPLTLAGQYRRVLSFVYASPMTLVGHSELRPWLWMLWPSDVVHPWLFAAAIIVLVAPLITAVARGGIGGRDRSLEMLALIGAISLLVTRHLSYDFILLLPAVVAWRRPPIGTTVHAPAWLFWGLSALLVAAIPSWSRLAIALGAPAGLAALTSVDRLMCLAVWGSLSWRVNADQSSGPAKASGT